MPYYSVTDFSLSYPAWPRPLRRIRKGAMTAFVDKASGELVAGYSYTTCLFAVTITAEHPTGQLHRNLTHYSVTTSGKHSWPLYTRIAKHLVDKVDWDWVDGRMVVHSRTPASAPVLEAIDVPQGTTAAELVVRCHMQLPVDVAVAARKAKVDAYNAAVDAGHPYPIFAAEAAEGKAQLEFWRTVRQACSEAEWAERRASRELYGDDDQRAWQREQRARARAAIKAEREAEREAELAAPAQPTPLAAQGNGLPPGCFMVDGKVYGRR